MAWPNVAPFLQLTPSTGVSVKGLNRASEDEFAFVWTVMLMHPVVPQPVWPEPGSAPPAKFVSSSRLNTLMIVPRKKTSESLIPRRCA